MHQVAKVEASPQGATTVKATERQGATRKSDSRDDAKGEGRERRERMSATVYRIAVKGCVGCVRPSMMVIWVVWCWWVVVWVDDREEDRR